MAFFMLNDLNSKSGINSCNGMQTIWAPEGYDRQDRLQAGVGKNALTKLAIN
jgi:hypothetical protein